ncbi:MAG: transpeptidase family protein [Bacteroidaceae bacterium]|nr:transpeptidase family protein [Bacteroidaceae bacterium]
MIEPKQNIILRYLFIASLILCVCVAILYKAGKTIFVEGVYWKEKASATKIEDIIVEPNRGNILAQDGRLMASSIPQYYMYIDFKAGGFKVDTFKHYLPQLSKALSAKLKNKSASEYASHLMKGYKSGSRHFLITPLKVSYTDLKEIKTFPFLRMNPNKSGFHTKAMMQRKKPFGSLASRTIGGIYGEADKGGKNGVELAYDSLLRGIPGTSTRQRVRGRWEKIINEKPIDGLDIKTTIDIEIQDITENALTEKLKEIDAESGTAVVMDVKTGEIKAITNIARIQPGIYAETKNHAVADEIEPGSTFKVASMMAAIDDGVVKPDDEVDTGNGVYMYAGARMTDHNWNHGGYHVITAEQAIWNSSNIGVAKLILKAYEKEPQKFVDKLYKMGLNEAVDLGIPGSGRPKIKHPIKDKNLWSRTSLPWMSFGYETQIPPIYTLMFFNAIANDGKMIKPIFVKEICRNGSTVSTHETETVRSSICSNKTLKIIRSMLVGVVENGTGKTVKSEHIKIAGKTGTAQIASGGRYRGSGHQVSFCGYFPADDPQYSCIVVIRRPSSKFYPSGGTMSGGVFKNIAEQIYAHSLSLPISALIPDSVHIHTPIVLNGNYKETERVLNNLDISFDDNQEKSDWIRTEIDPDKIEIKDLTYIENLVPQVVGMGARDATYLLESAGLKVLISGKGRVSSQSIKSGTKAIKGQTIVLTLK